MKKILITGPSNEVIYEEPNMDKEELKRKLDYALTNVSYWTLAEKQAGVNRAEWERRVTKLSRELNSLEGIPNSPTQENFG